MADLKIKPAGGTWDAIALGEVMLRLDPVDVPIAARPHRRIWHGGGETNVAEGLAACFGLKTAVLTALVDDGFGRNIEIQLREAGVDTSLIIWFNTEGKGKHSTDGKGTLHNGLNFTFRGKGVVPSVTEYYRAHSPVREVAPGDVDWEALFGRRACAGSTPAASTACSPPPLRSSRWRAMQAAGEHGVFRSFDLNYRSKVEPDKETARAINKKIAAHTDFLVGNQSDFFDALGYESRKVSNTDSFELWLEAYTEMLRAVAKEYPNLKIIGTQLRAAFTADRISWGAVLYDVAEDQTHLAAVRENIEIADRTGGGDSFMSGVAAAVMKGHDLATAVQWGAAHGILVQETPGDTTMVVQGEVEAEVARALKGGGVSALR